jgi:cyanate permease
MSDAAEPRRVKPEEDPYRWTMLGGVWLLYFCFGLIAAAMAPLVQPITEDLGLSHSAIGGVLGAWPLVYIASAIPCGAFLDRVGPHRALFFAVLIIALSGALRGLAPGHLSLFLAVGVFGLGGPLISVGAPKLITLWFATRERGLAMGIYITGPALGGILALSFTNSVLMPLFDHDWRAVLLAYAAFVGACSLVWFAITAHGVARAVERRAGAEPRQPQRQVFAELLRLPAVRTVLLMGMGIFFLNHGLNNWLPEILRNGGMSAAAAGYWASIPTAVGIPGALIIPRLALPERRNAILFGLFLC